MHINRLSLILLPILFLTTVLTGLIRTSAAQTAEPRYKTLPDFPPIITHVISDTMSDGYVFLTPGEPYNESLLILDNNGEPVYYKQAPDSDLFYDFKVQPDGSLTYIHIDRDVNSSGVPYYSSGAAYQMDNTYTTINSFVPVGDSSIKMDEHELQMLPNGNAMFLIEERRTVDMTDVITGGRPNAVAIDMVIQEVDPENNLLFDWNGGDYYDVVDIAKPDELEDQTIDYMHSNSIEIDHDGNILLSSRELNEVSKIDYETGELMWRMGGNNNQFTLLGDDQFFSFQHDARRVSTDTITVFDNIWNFDNYYSSNSRVLEYRLDEENLTAELIWEYEHPGGVWSWIMGNAQRQPNGNTMIGWGSGGYNGVRERRLFSEVSADGELLFDVEIEGYGSYRAFRFDWEGLPTDPPTIVAERDSRFVIDLYYSWNGATGTLLYELYGGTTPDELELLTIQSKDGFENSYQHVVTTNDTYYYQLLPLDAQGNPLNRSDIIEVPPAVDATAITLNTSTASRPLSLALLSLCLYLGIVTQKVGRKR